MSSAQILHQSPYFKIVSGLQYWAKIRETSAKTTAISLANHSNKNHLFRSYREKVITILVELCSKTRNQKSSRIYSTSNALSEVITNPKHMKFISKSKGIKCRIQKSNNYSIPRYTAKTITKISHICHTNFVSKTINFKHNHL
jgi:predicted ABC-class ATPase